MDTDQKIRNDLDAVKELYGQLFLLLDQSVQEDPLARVSAQLDLAIRQLTGVIDKKMVLFRQGVQRTRSASALSRGVDEAIKDFETSLAKGLTVMRERILERSRSMARQRDETRAQLKKVHHKKSGMKGYALPRMSGNFIESEI